MTCAPSEDSEQPGIANFARIICLGQTGARIYLLSRTIQTRTVSKFGAFYYMFIVNVGLYKETEFDPTKIHQKLKQKTCILVGKH